MVLSDGSSTTIDQSRKVYTKCPMCQGKGVLSYHELTPILQTKNTTLLNGWSNNGNSFRRNTISVPGSINTNELLPALECKKENPLLLNIQPKNEKHIRRNTISDSGIPLKLPVLVREDKLHSSSPDVQVLEERILAPDVNQNEAKTKNCGNRSHTGSPIFGKLILPSILSSPNKISNFNGKQKVPEKFVDGIKKDSLSQPRDFRNPQETVKMAVNNLRHTHWEIVLQALRDIVQISHYNSDLVEPNMPTVYRTLCQLLNSAKSQVTRTACQAAKELFRTMQYVQRPELDKVVSCLLQRTADLNRFIRDDSNDALDSMVMYIPAYHSVRVLVDKGAGHKNPLVRAATARLLTCAAMISGADVILSKRAKNRETRQLVLVTATKLLGDGNLETRKFAKKLLKFLMEHEDFDNIFSSVVGKETTEKLEKTLILLRHQIREESIHSSREMDLIP